MPESPKLALADALVEYLEQMQAEVILGLLATFDGPGEYGQGFRDGASAVAQVYLDGVRSARAEARGESDV